MEIVKPISAVDEIRQNRDAITALKDALLASPQANNVEAPVVHRFSPGLYLRQITMPKGSLVVGKIHATEHFNIIMSGRVTVATAEGVEHYKAGDIFVSKAGIQKAVYNHEECVWLTTHVTDETDLNLIEKEVIAESYETLKNDGLLQSLYDNIPGLEESLGDD